MNEEKIEMEIGKIYFLSYGGNTQILGRYKGDDACNYYWFDLVHYWNGFETFRSNHGYSVKHGVSEIRRATKPEKHTLIRFEIENETI